MTKIYHKNKLTFSLIWIGMYVVLASVADSLSDTIGITKIITAPLLFLMSVVMYIWLSKNGLAKENGLACAAGKKSGVLYYIPLVILITANLWNGVTLNMPIMDTVFYIVSMLFVGFLEEIIFRGLLFTSLCALGVKKAFIISSVTFGIGHIVNLLNGAELLPTILQIISAVAIGFLFTLIFYTTKSLWVCIMTHSIFNALSAFAVEPSDVGRIVSCTFICAIAVLYAMYLVYNFKKKQVAEKP